jgi:hypothetical protein
MVVPTTGSSPHPSALTQASFPGRPDRRGRCGRRARPGGGPDPADGDADDAMVALMTSVGVECSVRMTTPATTANTICNSTKGACRAVSTPRSWHARSDRRPAAMRVRRPRPLRLDEGEQVVCPFRENADADPPEIQGRPRETGKQSTRAPATIRRVCRHGMLEGGSGNHTRSGRKQGERCRTRVRVLWLVLERGCAPQCILPSETGEEVLLQETKETGTWSMK